MLNPFIPQLPNVADNVGNIPIINNNQIDFNFKFIIFFASLLLGGAIMSIVGCFVPTLFLPGLIIMEVGFAGLLASSNCMFL